MARENGCFAAIVALACLAACGGDGSREVAAPVLTSVEPRVVAPDVPFVLLIEGHHFGGPAYDEATAPTLTVVRTRDLEGNAVSGPSDSALVPVDVVDGVERIEVPVSFYPDAPPGLYGIRLRTRAGGEGSFLDAVALVPAPSIAGPEADAACLATPDPVVAVVGSDFLAVDGNGPTVTIDQGLGGPAPFTATPQVRSSGCRKVPFDRADVWRCARLEVSLPPETPAGGLRVSVAEPVPVERLPVLESRVYVDRPLLLNPFHAAIAVEDGPVDLGIYTSGLTFPPIGVHVAGGLPPPATIDGVPVASAVVGCSPSGVPGHDWCNELWITVPQGLSPGTHGIAVTTMPGCGGEASTYVAARPVISSVDPAVACVRLDRFTVNGSGFLRPHAFLGDIELTPTWECPEQPCGTFVGTWRPANPPPGSYLVTVLIETYPPLRSEPVPISLVPGPPVIMYPVPQTIYGGIESQVFVGFAQPVTTITGAAIADYGGAGRIPVSYAVLPDGVEITVPAGTPGGWYTVEVTEGGLCTGGSWQPLMIQDSYLVRSETFDTGPGSAYIRWEDGPQPWEPVPVIQWHSPGGNPGGAISYGSSGTSPTWYFAIDAVWQGADLALARFDLLRTVGGTDVAAPDVIIHGGVGALEYALPAPPGLTWTSYQVRLDDPAGWTFRDATGARPATAADLLAVLDVSWGLWIRGQYGSGANEAWLDNVAVELRH